MARELSRRQVLDLGWKTAFGVLAAAALPACNVNVTVQTGPQSVSPIPGLTPVAAAATKDGQPAPGAQPTAEKKKQDVPPADQTRFIEYVTELQNAGIKIVNMQGRPTSDIKALYESHRKQFPGYPLTYSEAAEYVTPSTGKGFAAEQVVPIIGETKINGRTEKTWTVGEWTFEAWPLKTGVKFDTEKGYHVDASGNPVFDQQKIFDFPKNPTLVNFGEHGPVETWARRGGATANGLPNQTHFHTENATVNVQSIEQAELRPLAACPVVGNNSYHNALGEIIWNPKVYKGFNENGKIRFIDVNWFNNEKNAFESIDMRMLRQLVSQGFDQDTLTSIIEQLPAGFPVSPEMASKKWGGNAENWIPNFDYGMLLWHYEAFKIKDNVTYKPGVGYVKGGMLLSGDKQIGGTSDIFDFNQSDSAARISKISSSANGDGAFYAKSVKGPKIVLYYLANGGATPANAGIEQVTANPISVNNCVTLADQRNAATEIAKGHFDANKGNEEKQLITN